MSSHIAFTPEEHDALGLNPNIELECFPFPPRSTAETLSDSMHHISTIVESIDNSAFLIDNTGFNRRICGLYTAACYPTSDIPTQADGSMPCSYSETTKQNTECLEFLGKILPQYAYLTAAADPRDAQSVERVQATIRNCEKEDLEKMRGSVTVNPQQVWTSPTKNLKDDRPKKKKSALRHPAHSSKRARRKPKGSVQATNSRITETKRQMRKRISTRKRPVPAKSPLGK